ncbi:MAG: septum formation protein Maf [Chthoniobacterales bacterium]|nr:septum formation protein Maf [Chthoniobacterales bacterium]
MSGSALRFILASGSPRRRELLGEAGYHFEVVAPKIAELSPDALTLREITRWNAFRKGLAVARAHPDAVVLAADTLVALDREIIGKPADLAEARCILTRLSGRHHTVSTGVFLGRLASGRSETFSVVSRVVFKKMSAQQIEAYLREVEPLDKAGAYAAQGRGRAIVARIAGSRSNVIGLPLEKIRPALARFGLRPNA